MLSKPYLAAPLVKFKRRVVVVFSSEYFSEITIPFCGVGGCENPYNHILYLFI